MPGAGSGAPASGGEDGGDRVSSALLASLGDSCGALERQLETIEQLIGQVQASLKTHGFDVIDFAPAAQAAGGSHAAPAKDPPMIWLLARGSLGEVMPLVSLALGLQAASYRVKAFIPGTLQYVFRSYGIPCLAADMPICFRMAQIRKFLRVKAAEVTTGSEADLSNESFEDIYLDLRMQMTESLHWRTMTAWKDAFQDSMASIAQIEERFQEIWDNTAIDIDAWWGFFRSEVSKCMEHSALRAGMELQAYIKLRAQKRRRFLAELKARAWEACVIPLDFLESLHFTIKGHMQKIMQECMSTGKPTVAEVTRHFEDYVSWERDRSPERWWEVWLRRLPDHTLNQGDVTAFNLQARSAVVHAHVMHEAGHVMATNDKPELVIYRLDGLPIAQQLARNFGIRTLPYFSECVPAEVLRMLCSCQGITSREQGITSREQAQLIRRSGLAAPSKGPGGFDRQLVSVSPLLFQEFGLEAELWQDDGWSERCRQCYRGFFYLDAGRQLQATDPRLFGGQKARKELEAFISKNCRGETPVCFAWGHMTDSRGPVSMAATLVAALRSARRRGVVVSRWTRLTPEVLRSLPREDAEYAEEHVLLLRAAPFEWLFPRCCCIVTYGGKGTMGAIMRSGTPAVIVTEDVLTLSCEVRAFRELGTSLLHEESWDMATPQALATSINMVISSQRHQRAVEEVQQKVAADKGADGAVDVVARVLRLSAEDLADDCVFEPEPPANPQDAETMTPCYPWANGEYDVYEVMSGEHMDRINIQGDRGELSLAPGRPVWFQVCNRLDAYNKNSDQQYMVQCYWKGISWANVTSDGRTWNFSNGVRFVYREGISKNCECAIS